MIYEGVALRERRKGTGVALLLLSITAPVQPPPAPSRPSHPEAARLPQTVWLSLQRAADDHIAPPASC
jgi:hypothetical protein